MLFHILAIVFNALLMCGAGSYMILAGVGKVRIRKSEEANREFMEKHARLVAALGIVLVLLGLLNTVVETIKLF